MDVSIRNTNIGTIKQNNTNSINFVINMVDGGYPVDLSDVTYAMISIKRPNGSVSNSIATLSSNGVVSYLLEPNAVNLTGLYEAEIQLFASGDSLLISSTFYYNIQESLYSDGSVTSQPEYPILVQLISDVTAMGEALAPIAADEATRQANEISRVSNENTRVTSETARVSAENTRATNESTRQTNETGRVSAESTRVSQENTRQSNETARVSAESSRVTAENNRDSNESIRNQGFVTAMGEESERIDNENARILAEGGRQSAESIRVTSENARISAESSRASAEITRAANEIIREQFEFKGNYDAGTQYLVNNVVIYNGSSYACIVNSIGNLPTNATYWKMVAQKGVDGLGAGDMLKAVYDQDDDGIVDNSERLGGELPAYYTNILARLGYTPISQGIVTAANDFIIGSGNASVVKKTLAETKTILGVNAATESAKGVVELATAAETTAGSDNTRAVHPAGLKVELDKKVNKAGDTMTGALKFNRCIQARNYKDVLHYHNAASSTGTLKIKLPSGVSDTMMAIKIKGYTYVYNVGEIGGEFELDLGGYVVNGTWYTTSTKLNGKAVFNKVRFGYDGINPLILLGDLSTVWNIPSIVITDFIATFGNVDGFETGWSASIITSEAGLTNIVEASLQIPANKTQENWIEPTLLNGWVNYGDVIETMAYMKDEFGFVHVKGTVKSGGLGQPIFVFPKGYRPSKILLFPCGKSDGTTIVEVYPDGGVLSPMTGGAGAIVSTSFDGIIFRAEG